MNLKFFTPRNLAHMTRNLLDKFRGLDFLYTIQPEDVGLDRKCAYESSPSGNKYLVNMLSDFSITSEDFILDIGCGKGSAMRTMLAFPFGRVDGIELSEHIAAIAARNFKRLNATRTTVFVCDASLFRDYDAYRIVYFYNPFPSDVMSLVVDALIQSIHRSKRELVIIYKNPTCHDVVVKKGVFSKIGVYPDEKGTRISIYSNRDGGDSRLSANKRLQRPADKACAR